MRVNVKTIRRKTAFRHDNVANVKKAKGDHIVLEFDNLADVIYPSGVWTRVERVEENPEQQ